MIFETDFMRLYEELEQLSEGKNKQKKTVISIPQSNAKNIDLDSFLHEIGLVPISVIAPACSNTSNSGASIWVPAAQSPKEAQYEKAIPYFDRLINKRLPKFVETLGEDEYPSKIFTTDGIQNNGGRKLSEVRLGESNNVPWRGLWFRTTSGKKRYFIFGSIFYKDAQKINAASSKEVAYANKFYDAVMKKLNQA